MLQFNENGFMETPLNNGQVPCGINGYCLKGAFLLNSNAASEFKDLLQECYIENISHQYWNLLGYIGNLEENRRETYPKEDYRFFKKYPELFDLLDDYEYRLLEECTSEEDRELLKQDFIVELREGDLVEFV